MKVRVSGLRESPFATSIYSTEATPDLIESIRMNGVLQPIWVTEDNQIIAGHRRVNACKSLGLDDIPAVVKAYSDMLVIESNRYREKTWTEKLREVEALGRIEKPKARERQAEGGRSKVLHNCEQAPVLMQTAKAIGTSHTTLHKVQTIAKAKPELIADIDQGKKSVNSAYRLIKREQNLAEFHKKEVPLPEGKFNVIYADPPWRYEHPVSRSRDIENQYPTMALEDICALPVGEFTADDAILFLWATNPKLDEALRVMRAWGFDYRTNMVWVKNRIGLGYWVRQKHELLLIGRRGQFPPPPEDSRSPSVIEAKVTTHSKKPVAVYGLIEGMYPTGKYIELFARESRGGWKSWGLEADNTTSGKT